MSNEIVSNPKFKIKSHKFKVFIEGIEIPFNSLIATFSAQSQFSIIIPPFNEGIELEANSYALIAFKENEISPKWHLLCEGIYSGSGYSKRPQNRSLTLNFKDIKWYLDENKLFDLFKMDNIFAPFEIAFFGDNRYDFNTDDAKKIAEENSEKVDPFAKVRFQARTEFLANFNDEEDHIKKSVEWVLNNLKKANKFIEAHSKALNLDSSRFNILQNNRTKQIFTNRVLNSIYEGIFQEMDGDANSMDLVYSLAQNIFYDIYPIPCFSSEDMKSFVFKPEMKMTIPPACNIVFPDEVSSINFNVDFSSIPTRYRFVDILEGQSLYGYYAPKEIKEDFNEDKYGELIGPRGKITDEEKIRGILPAQDKIPFETALSLGDFGDMKDELANYKSLYANYAYYERKFRSIPLNVEISFKPDLLPGFPIIIMDREIPLIGYLRGVNHNISVEQSYAYTTATISHMRPIHWKLPMLSGWYDREQFTPENITSNIYNQLGTKSAFDIESMNIKKPVIDDNEEMDLSDSIAGKDNSIMSNYLSHPNRMEFQNAFKRKLPIFFNEDNENGESILKTLGLNWDRERKILVEDGSKDSTPLSIDLKMENGEFAGQSVSEVRKDKVKKLKKRMDTHNVAKRKYSDEEEE